MLYAGLIVLVVAALGGAVYWVRRVTLRSAALDTRTAELAGEQAHVDAMEAAAAEQREQRAKDFDAKAASVSDARGAAELLRDSLARTPR